MQLENIVSAALENAFEISTDFNERQLLNALLSMFLTLFGIAAAFKDEQSANANRFIETSPSGRMNEANEEHP